MFLPYKSDNGAVLPWEYLTASAGTYKAGQLLTISGGQAVPVAAALQDTPPYLCMADITITGGGEMIPVTRISKDWIYETALSADTAAADVGVKLQVAAGGLQLADGTGSFEIVSLAGNKAGDVVHGRWN